MTDEHSTDTGEEDITTPLEIELSSIADDDTRTLAKRYAEQERWNLTESARNAFVAFVRDPVKGLEMMDAIDPNVSKRVLKDLWVSSVAELAKKTEGFSEEKMSALIDSRLKENSFRDVKTNIEAKLQQLPDTIREKAQKEFVDLTEGRTLSPEQLEVMANKAVTLARHDSGIYEKNAKLNFWSQSISSVESSSEKSSDFLQTTTHPFFKNFKQ